MMRKRQGKAGAFWLREKIVPSLVILTMLLGVAVTLTKIVPTKASGSYNNADIATDALTHLGQTYGQCWTFARDMIYQASNHTQDITAAAGGGDYFAHLQNAGGAQITDITKLSKGDIVQIGEYDSDPNLHTFIIVGLVSGNNFTVVDANHDYKGTVLKYQRTVSLGSNERAYRFGTVNGSSGSPSAYAGKIVQWNGDTKTQKTSWLVSPDLKRYWIPDSSTFNCLTSQGFAFAGAISSTLLNQLPDQTGKWARCGNNSLGTNQFLFRGSYLRSSNGLYFLQLQRSDGNLVLYGPNGALWANSRSSDYLVMQGDNNLVTYRYGVGATWATGTGGTGANHLVVKDDGNLVLYTSGGVPIWDRYWPRPGDCNGDGHVDAIDLSILLSHYNQAYNPCDFNIDGIVNVVDLSILESHYGT